MKASSSGVPDDGREMSRTASRSTRVDKSKQSPARHLEVASGTAESLACHQDSGAAGIGRVAWLLGQHCRGSCQRISYAPSAIRRRGRRIGHKSNTCMWRSMDPFRVLLRKPSPSTNLVTPD